MTGRILVLVVFLGLTTLLTAGRSQEDAAALTLQGVNYAKEGYWDLARRTFQTAVDQDPRYTLAHFNLGIALEKLGRMAEAEKAYQKAVETDPGFVSAHMNLAVLYNQEHKYDQAIVEMERVLTLEPNHAAAHYNLGYLYARKKQYPLAWQHARQASALNYPQAQKLLRDLQDQSWKGKNVEKPKTETEAW